MNVNESKPSFVLLCSIQHSNYISPCCRAYDVNGQNKIVSLASLDEISSEHSSLLRSVVLLQSSNQVCRMSARSKNHPTCAFTIGLQPTLGQKRVETKRELANKTIVVYLDANITQ